MGGYWRDEKATARTLRDGWLWTGDLGSFDEHGFLTLKDRSKDVIISGGSNIYPCEVEEVLLRHHSVAEVPLSTDLIPNGAKSPSPMSCSWTLTRVGQHLIRQ